MKKSKWEEESDYWLDEEAPAWWEIAIPVIVMVIVIVILVVSSWRLG